MNPPAEWLQVPGWGGAYQVERHTGVVRSRPRVVVDSLGRCRRLRGIELAPVSFKGIERVTLSFRGHRRSFTSDELFRRARRNAQSYNEIGEAA